MPLNDLPAASATSDPGRRVMEWCDRLAQYSEETGCLTRTFLSPPMHEVHASLKGWMQEIGLTTRVDAVGNLIGRYAAQAEDAPILLMGSHVDTVPDAGKYDGALGVILALAALERLEGRRLSFTVDIIAFSEEEGVRFGTPYLGSLALAGKFDREGLLPLRDPAGVSLAEAIRAFGLDPDLIPNAAYEPRNILGYIEAHIEQGPILEERGVPVGVVTAIAGQTRARLQFVGQAVHAGTTPMPLRRDALAAAAEFIGVVEATGSATEGLVATVGRMVVTPNASNVVPGQVEVSLDVRHAEDRKREDAVSEILGHARDIAVRRQVNCEVIRRQDFAAVPMDERLRALLVSAVGTPTGVVELVSGAGHDAAVMAGLCPAAMLFVLSPNGGLSHHPDEAVWPADAATAVEVLRRFLLMLEASRTVSALDREG